MTLAALALALTVHATVTPAHTAQLVPVSVAISVVNRGHAAQTLEFPSADLFDVQVRDKDGKVVFDSNRGYKPIEVHRKLYVPIGTSRVAAFVWNALGDDRHAPAPGTYDVHVEMQSTSEHLVADVPLVLDPPATVSAAVAIKAKTEITIAGDAVREGGVTYLQDETGKIALSGPLSLHPEGSFVVRGIPDDSLGKRRMIIDRSAPAAGNLQPEATPTPLPSPTGAQPTPRRSG